MLYNTRMTNQTEPVRLIQRPAPFPDKNVTPTPKSEMFPVTLQNLLDKLSPVSQENSVGMAVHCLTLFSAHIGPAVYMPIGSQQKYLNEYVLLITPTGLTVEPHFHLPSQLFQKVEQILRQRSGQHNSPLNNHYYSNLKTYDKGILNRKAILELMSNSESSRSDKRLMLYEPDFSVVSTACHRPTSQVFWTLRNAFDGLSTRLPSEENNVGLSNAYLCLFGHISPAQLRHFSQLSYSTCQNLLSRCLILYQPPETTDHQMTEFPNNIIDQYANRLADCILKSRNEIYCQKIKPLARPITFSQSSLKLCQAFFNDSYPIPDKVTSIYSQSYQQLHAKILASLFALLDYRFEGNDQDMKSALAWCQYSLSSILYTLDLNNWQNHHEQQVSKKVLHAIASVCKTKHKCTSSDIYRKFSGRLKKPQLSKAISLLSEWGVLPD